MSASLKSMTDNDTKTLLVKNVDEIIDYFPDYLKSTAQNLIKPYISDIDTNYDINVADDLTSDAKVYNLINSLSNKSNKVLQDNSDAFETDTKEFNKVVTSESQLKSLIDEILTYVVNTPFGKINPNAIKCIISTVVLNEIEADVQSNEKTKNIVIFSKKTSYSGLYRIKFSINLQSTGLTSKTIECTINKTFAAFMDVKDLKKIASL